MVSQAESGPLPHPDRELPAELPGASRERIDSTLPDDIFQRPVPRPAQVHATTVDHLRRGPNPIRVAGLLRRGSLVDKYQIEEVLGVGGFAAVYRATHLLLRMPAAIKMLRQDVLARRPTLRTQLIEEARFAARINHPNVVRIFDATHSDDLTYIVMEYIDGAALSRRLTHGRIELAAALRLGLDIAAGLRAGLAQGLIHRDVKPANILMSREGNAKLVDFGMAHAPEDVPPESSSGPIVVGTRGYMAPEQALDSTRADFRADIYALGVTLAEAVTGHRMRSRRKVPMVENADELTNRFMDLVQRMQSPMPQMRPSSYETVIDELEELLNEVQSARDRR